MGQGEQRLSGRRDDFSSPYSHHIVNSEKVIGHETGGQIASADVSDIGQDRGQNPLFAQPTRQDRLPKNLSAQRLAALRAERSLITPPNLNATSSAFRIIKTPEAGNNSGNHRPHFFASQIRQERIARLRALAKARAISVRDLVADHATNTLKQRFPHYCACLVISSRQKWFLILLALVALLTFLINKSLAIGIIGTLFTLFCLSTTLLRCGVLAAYCEADEAPLSQLDRLLEEGNTGTCSVLVALYRERNQVESLVAALKNLKWPEGQIEVLIVCEADDHETLSKLREIRLPYYFSVLSVPPIGPRTKPKALNYALTLACGDQLVIYDAEDRPHPYQLLEARQKFAGTTDRLACVQAPLLIHNHRTNWLTQIFALEYASLFLGVLPVLARWNMPLPLGGTSNHFRTHVLKKIGGWDPYNVTEDADLGIRLYRENYRCATITLPTLEEAPSTFSNWLPQRTRWMKGWMQTQMVHLRSPIMSYREMGRNGMMIFAIIQLAITLCALVHPFFVVASIVFIPLALNSPPDILISAFLGISVFNLVSSYLSHAVLAIEVSPKNRLRANGIWLLLLPIYWLMISFAAWRALFQLFTRPFHWEKTEHLLSGFTNGSQHVQKRSGKKWWRLKKAI